MVYVSICLSVCVYVCLCVCVSLPEVPTLWDTVCVCVELPRDDENVRHHLVEAVRDYGHVWSRAPVQITDISERPAALLVHWAQVSRAILSLLGL